MRDTNQKLTIPAVFLSLLCCALWGSAVLFVKDTYTYFNIDNSDIGSQLLVAGIRFIMAGLMILLFLVIRGRPIGLKGIEYKYALHLSMYQTVLQYIFFYIGIANTTGVIASLATGCNAFNSFLASCYLYRQEPFRRNKMIGCVIGFTGIVCCVGDGGLAVADVKLIGVGSCLLSSAFYALSSCQVKKYSLKMESVKLCGHQFLMGGILLFGLGLAMGGKLTVAPLAGVLCLAYLGMVSAVAYSVWSVLLSRYDVSKITGFSFSIPIFGIVFTCVAHPQELANITFITLIALVFVVLGIVILNKKSAKPLC